MGRNNRSRRAAKTRRKRVDGYRQPSPVGDQRAPGSVAVDVEEILTAAVDAEWRGRTAARDGLLDRLAREPRTEVAGALGRLLEEAVAGLWEDGWQPADVVRLVGRDLGKREAAIVRWAIGAQAATYEQWGRAVAPEWMRQLDHLGGVPSRDPSTPWPVRLSGGWPAILLGSVRILSLRRLMWPIPLLMPPPSEWPNMSRPARSAASHIDPGMLDRIRALLAKAESTEFDAEAEAFTAKAQELMTRHRIDRASVAGRSHGDGEAVGRRIGVDDPYSRQKALLLMGIAAANSCRAAWSKGLGFATVFGRIGDIDGVEELYTSLLVQATTAMHRQGASDRQGGHRRSARFRRSFLVGFAVRIGQRLRDANDQTVKAAEQTSGMALVPLFAAREREAEEAMRSTLSIDGRMSVSATDGEGYWLGQRAAEAADLAVSAARLDD